MISWDGRKRVLNYPLQRFTDILGSSCWRTMKFSMRGCLGTMELNPYHMNGLVCIETHRMHFPNNWLVLATLRILDLAQCNLVRSSQPPSIKNLPFDHILLFLLR